MRPSLLFIALATGCNLGDSVGFDARLGRDADTSDGARDGPDGDTPATGDERIDAAHRGGSMTHIAERTEFLTERICDLDGNGTLDNSIADLGEPMAQIFAIAAAQMLTVGTRETDRFLVHFPWIEDIETPHDASTLAIIFNGRDLDGDPSNDRSGHEPFHVRGDSVDDCGEPLYVSPEFTIEAGEITGHVDGMAAPIPGESLAAYNATILGTIEPGGASMSYEVCCYVLVSDLGRVVIEGLTEDSTLTALEVITAGGRLLGTPTMPGISPDVDLDGDGLERIMVDDAGHITGCIDGDLREIEGRDCWQDPSMADALSINVATISTTAVLAGLEPEWRSTSVHEACQSPPEESLWDPP